ncbi:MAG: ATP:cob(I)alamin adenosyltransferase [Elusimicrobia bacterium]|nr:ATP:cob(I)alamin adenosyltransferase [Elusimicrobiota bacterium]
MKKLNFKPKIGSGDTGYTDIKSMKVKKTDKRIKFNAALDKINALIGLVRSFKKDKELFKIQQDILKISSFAAGYGEKKEIENSIELLTLKIKSFPCAKIPKKFIVFGSNKKSALINLIRTEIRIAEIQAWEINKKEIAVYLNRLSDYLFLLSLKK